MKQLPALLLWLAASLPAAAADAPRPVETITWLSSDTSIETGRPRSGLGDSWSRF